MSQPIIRLCNQHAGQLDLSSVHDTDGRAIVLQPKGLPKSTCSCYEDVLQHPHVQTFLEAKWVTVEQIHGNVAAPVVSPFSQSAPIVEDEADIEEVPVVEEPAPVIEEAAPVVEAPVVEEAAPVIEEASVVTEDTSRGSKKRR